MAGVDVARGVALLGMFAVHIFPARTPSGGVHPAYVVFAGRSAALFAVMAGVGLALATGGPRPRRARELLAARSGVLARAGFLVLLGLLLALVDSPPLVILAYYGTLFLLALPFLGLRARPLVALAILWALGAPLVSHFIRSGLGPSSISESGGGSLPLVLTVTGTYPALPWLTYLLAGLAIGRLPLSSRRVAVGMSTAGAVLALAAKLLSGWLLSTAGGAAQLASETGVSRPEVTVALERGLFGTTPTATPAWLLVSAPHSGTTLDLAHTVGTSMLVLGVCLLLTQRRVGLLGPVAAAGSMTLTLYCAHVLALANGSPLRSDRELVLWAAHCAAAIMVAMVWQRWVGRGPLEAAAGWLDRAARSFVTQRAERPTASNRDGR